MRWSMPLRYVLHLLCKMILFTSRPRLPIDQLKENRGQRLNQRTASYNPKLGWLGVFLCIPRAAGHIGHSLLHPSVQKLWKSLQSIQTISLMANKARIAHWWSYLPDTNGICSGTLNLQACRINGDLWRKLLPCRCKAWRLSFQVFEALVCNALPEIITNEYLVLRRSKILTLTAFFPPNTRLRLLYVVTLQGELPSWSLIRAKKSLWQAFNLCLFEY